ncbi:MAG: hypothetical protein ACOCWG_01080 [bacterium]
MKTITIKKKHLLLVLSIICFFLILIPGIPYFIGFAMFFLSFIGLSLYKPLYGLYLIFFSLSFNGLIRWKMFDSFILAGFSTILVFIFILCQFILLLVNKEYRINVHFKNFIFSKSSLGFYLFVIISIFFALLTINVPLSSEKLIEMIMKYREYIIPILFIPFSISFIKKSTFPRIIEFYVYGAVIIALINIIHLLFGLPIGIPRFVLHFSSQLPEIRSMFGIYLPRMNHILGLSTQGAGATFYTIAGIAGIYLEKNKCSITNKLIWNLIIVVLFIASLLTVSFSMLLTIFFVFLFFKLINAKKKISLHKLLLGLPILVFFIYFLLFSEIISIDRKQNFFEYGIMTFFKKLTLLEDFNFAQIIFGIGVGLKSGMALGVANLPGSDMSNYIFDHWIFVVFYQLGFIGFFLQLLIYFFCFFIIKRNIHIGRDIENQRLLIVIIFGSLGFLHGSVLIERLFSPLFLLAISYLVKVNSRSSFINPLSESKNK